MRLSNYILKAQEILAAYAFPEPFHLYLKNYFKKNKAFGSKDRKIISALLFGYFRIGKQPHLSTAQAMQLGVWLSANLDVKYYNDDFFFPRDRYNNTIDDKVAYLQTLQLKWELAILPTLENKLEQQAILQDYLKPHAFSIRVRKNKKRIEKQLEDANIAYTCLDEDIILLQDNVDITTILTTADDYVVQDGTSIQVANSIKVPTNAKVWDCCAASGGKSLCILDNAKKTELTVSDIRPSILQNLAKRFKQYGYAPNHSFVHDATRTVQKINKQFEFEYFDVIIADVPCSGSGTWARTPEQYYFFNTDALLDFNKKQSAIIQNIWPFVKVGGALYYITCSVFEQENSAVVNTFLQNNVDAKVTMQELKVGIANKIDTMFIATIIKTITA